MSDEEADDAQLMLAAQGDGPASRAARERVIARHGPAIMRMLRIQLRDGAAAQDAFQDTFAAAFRSADTFKASAGSLRPWLFAIARNSLRRAHRQVAREQLTEPDWFALGQAAGFGADGPEQRLSTEEARTLLAQALAALAEEEREVLLLRDLEGLPGEQVAQLLGLGLAAMKSRLHRARLKLMAAYREQEAGVMANEKTVAGLRCRDVLVQLSGYVDGELAQPERQRIEQHLLGCSVCERFGGRFSGTVHALRGALGADLAVDSALVETLRARLSGDAG